MSLFSRLFGGKKKKEYTLHIEGPKFGPIGQTGLREILEDVRSRLNDRYGHLFRSTRSMASLDVGGASLTIETYKITSEQALEITDFGQKCFEEHKGKSRR